MKLLRQRSPGKANRNAPRRYPEKEKDDFTRGLCPRTPGVYRFMGYQLYGKKTGRRSSPRPQPSSHLGRRSGRSPAEPCPPPR
jgi:hypothetical protein